MHIWNPKLSLSALAITAALGVASIAHADTAQPFEGLSGKWSGEGSIALTNGTTERLRCEATYTVSGGGSNLAQALRCNSDSYNFDLRVNLEDQAGEIVGQWNEVTKGVQGGISGQETKGLIQAVVRGQAFSANVTVATRGSEQSVKIRAESGDLSQVTITLRHAR